MNGPLFIGGPARSGKTLVRWILASHPRIAVTRRTEMWSRFADRYGDLGDAGNLERCLEAMMARPQIAALEPDLGRVRHDLGTGEPTYARLFASINRQYADRCGKARWGDQSPANERFAGPIMAAYPDARFVHLLRDPRDCAAALLLEKQRRRSGVARWTASWLVSAVLAREHAERYPVAYLVVRYEDLVAEPERTVRHLCHALGERFEPAMLSIEGAERYREQRRSSGGIAISAAFVGAYRRALSPPVVAAIQSAAGGEMERLGYALDDVRLSAPQRIRSAAASPRRAGARVRGSTRGHPSAATDAGGGR
jgi:hypothetical protein